MTNLRKNLTTLAAAAVLGVQPVATLALVATGAAMLTACKKEEPPPPPPPPPPPAPVDPDRVMFSSLRSEMSIDPRVSLAEDLEVYDYTLAKAGLAFASAFAKGADDFDALGELMTEPTRNTLDELVGAGSWFDVLGEIESVRVVEFTQQPNVSEEAFSGTIFLALQEPGVSYVLGFSATKGAEDRWVWSQAWSTPLERARASDWDDADISELTEVVATADTSSKGANARRMAEALAGSDKMIYVAMELSLRLMPKLGIDQEFTIDQLLELTAPSLGMPASEVRSKYDAGKSAIENTGRGESKVDPAMLRGMIEGVKAQMEMQAQMMAQFMPDQAAEMNPLTDDMLFETLGEILDMTAADVKKMYDDAAP